MGSLSSKCRDCLKSKKDTSFERIEGEINENENNKGKLKLKINNLNEDENNKEIIVNQENEDKKKQNIQHDSISVKNENEGYDKKYNISPIKESQREDYIPAPLTCKKCPLPKIFTSINNDNDIVNHSILFNKDRISLVDYNIDEEIAPNDGSREFEDYQEKEEEFQVILIGLNNIGATCYMNATLQCLSNTDELTKFFLNEFKYEQNNSKKIMSNEYYNLIKKLWNKENNNKSFSPNEFKKTLSKENPLFSGIAANDSKDLINFLIERFHKELNEVNEENNFNNNDIKQIDQLNEQKMLEIFKNEFKEKKNSIISKLFYGILETKSQCQNCKFIKFNFQIFSFIEFPLEKVNQYCFNTGKRLNYNFNNNNKNPDIDLIECFEYNQNIELMAGDNQMYCNICNQLCDSLFQSLLYSTPNKLIINLNRGRNAIYECNVNFPEILNISNFVYSKDGNTIYELYAVICHIGPSSMSGHFVAYCKNRMDCKWYLYNDAFVTLCEKGNEYKNGMPYILFYQHIIVA